MSSFNYVLTQSQVITYDLTLTVSNHPILSMKSKPALFPVSLHRGISNALLFLQKIMRRGFKISTNVHHFLLMKKYLILQLSSLVQFFFVNADKSSLL